MNDSEEGNEMIDDENAEILSQDLVQCPACLRRMRPDIFSKHPNVCRENPTKKRHVRAFDMTQYRSIKSGDKTIPVRKVSPPNINTTRPSQTRSAKRDRRSDTLIPPVINNFSCPNCKRTFCEKAYDRHVKFCSSKLKQLEQPPSEEVLLARLKLDRRNKFNTNRFPSDLSQTTPISIPSINKQTVKQKSETICFLSIQKPHSDTLARCPWCSKPYLPNCIHYCRNSKELFSIQSK